MRRKLYFRLVEVLAFLGVSLRWVDQKSFGKFNLRERFPKYLALAECKLMVTLFLDLLYFDPGQVWSVFRSLAF